MQALINTIETAFENRGQITPGTVDKATKEAIWDAVNLLDSGKARVAEKINGQWVVNQWLKKAVLLFFKIENSKPMDAVYTQFFDKVPLK